MSMRTEPVKYSAGPSVEGCEPGRLSCIKIFRRKDQGILAGKSDAAAVLTCTAWGLRWGKIAVQISGCHPAVHQKVASSNEGAVRAH
jgi:hypothetical protein